MGGRKNGNLKLPDVSPKTADNPEPTDPSFPRRPCGPMLQWRKMKLTLGQVFGASLLALVAVLAVLFYVVFEASQTTIVESSEHVRDVASLRISESVQNFLSKAPATVEQFQLALNRGLVDPGNAEAVEATFFAPLLANPDIGEITLTYGDKTGFDKEGEILLEPKRRGQITVARTPDAKGGEQYWSRHIHLEGGTFVSDHRDLREGGRLADQPLRRETGKGVDDPTLHPTFTTPAREDIKGILCWSDLHRSQLDADLPEPQRRVEMSVQQVVTDASGKFAGVLRVGLLTRELSRLVQLKMTVGEVEDPHLIFICDALGRLITRGVTADQLQDFEDDLRISLKDLPKPIAQALNDPNLRMVGQDSPLVSGHFRQGQDEYLSTFRALPGTQDWILGIVVPRAHYLGKLTATRNRLLLVSLGMMILLIVGGSLILRSVRRAQSQIITESAKMNAFNFAPASSDSTFRDVGEVLESLEKAKTAMRAMGKYVPVDLVRRLYRDKSEPVLGGEPMEVSLMFTDIRDFTTLSEKLEPNVLADALGRYLDVMAGIIQQETGGTIDKYIGDAIMTIWNAPEPVKDHAIMACRAALRCRDAGLALSQSPEWRNLSAFETRFGLHCGHALVGHFGAHDRMNYTAIGDAVNLASRLEGLNKQYGTAIIASEHIVEETRGHFEFRLLDLVAVKGKSAAVRIHELLGEKGTLLPNAEICAGYEKAFAAYLARDFSGAVSLLEKYPSDMPGIALLERCRALQKEPPPPSWNGVYVSKVK